MQNQIDLTKITDVKELKSLAFDQLSALELAKSNLSAIYAQMNKVSNPGKVEEVKADEEVKA